MRAPDLNPDHIPNLATRQIMIQLLSVIEALTAENTTLRVEIQHLRIVDWLIAAREDAALAELLIAESDAREGVQLH